MSTTLYAWANPLSAWNGADHTWVTTYPQPSSCPPTPDYWYCWGVCHPTGPGTTARLLGSQSGDLAFASCICGPNKSSEHGGINLYGVQGVCHQLANRVLYATGPSPLTVSGAHMYWLSHSLFGTYGTTFIDWAKRKKKCALTAKRVARAATQISMTKSDLAVFDARIKKQLGTRYTADVMTRLHALQMKLLDGKKQLDEQVVAGQISGEEFASKVNTMVNRYLVDLGAIIGRKNCHAIFEAEPGEKVVIVDPKIAGGIDYTE